MFQFLIVIILAVIQGLTEFFPVSSSGHIVLFKTILGSEGEMIFRNGIIFEAAVHVGTLGAVIVVYRRRLLNLFKAIILWARGGFRRKEGFSDDISYVGWIILGSIPTGVFGIVLHDTVSKAFNMPLLVAVSLIITGVFLLFARGKEGSGEFTLGVVLLIGMAQVIGIIPGCSRSGWTITTALLLGVGFKRAAEFSFLLSVPAIIGAFLFECQYLENSLTKVSIVILLVGSVTAFLAGLVALRLLLHILKEGSFHRFSYYLIPAGIISAGWLYYF
ncbi:MAG: undecaprenyl-diphosphate phosphatase [Candidatus Krumholzibacteriota bacterium]|nr:undecaprenyl-diphosphate phosphatase [Candidatus Krumholzibacteriota bacterium]